MFGKLLNISLEELKILSSKKKYHYKKDKLKRLLKVIKIQEINLCLVYVIFFYILKNNNTNELK